MKIMTVTLPIRMEKFQRRSWSWWSRKPHINGMSNGEWSRLIGSSTWSFQVHAEIACLSSRSEPEAVEHREGRPWIGFRRTFAESGCPECFLLLDTGPWGWIRRAFAGWNKWKSGIVEHDSELKCMLRSHPLLPETSVEQILVEVAGRRQIVRILCVDEGPRIGNRGEQGRGWR